MGWQKYDRRHCSQIALGTAPKQQALGYYSVASPFLAFLCPLGHPRDPQPKFRRFCFTEQPCRTHGFSFSSSRTSVVLHAKWWTPLPFYLSFSFFPKISTERASRLSAYHRPSSPFRTPNVRLSFPQDNPLSPGCLRY